MTKPKTTLTQKDVLATKGKIHQLDLWTFEEVDEDAFAALSPLKHYLNFSGLTSLSESAAEESVVRESLRSPFLVNALK